MKAHRPLINPLRGRIMYANILFQHTLIYLTKYVQDRLHPTARDRRQTGAGLIPHTYSNALCPETPGALCNNEPTVSVRLYLFVYLSVGNFTKCTCQIYIILIMIRKTFFKAQYQSQSADSLELLNKFRLQSKQRTKK